MLRPSIRSRVRDSGRANDEMSRGEGDHEHFGRIARQLSPPRRAILESLEQHGAMSTDDIATDWQTREPHLSPRTVSRLDRVISQSLWKLENLGMVVQDRGLVSITPLGRQQLNGREA